MTTEDPDFPSTRSTTRPRGGRIGILALLALVAFAASAQAEKVELNSGESFEGEVVEETDELIVLEHPVLGRLEIPRSEIKPPEEEKVKPGLFGTGVLRGWTRSVGLGFSGSSGDSDEASFNTTLDIENETERYRGDFSAVYFYGSTDGEVTSNYFNTSYQHDFLFTESRWFLFGRAAYSYDEFQEWVHRVGGDGGVGYSFIRNDTIDFRGQAGVGVIHEFGDIDDTKPEGVFGLVFVWNIVEGQRFRASTTYYPNWKDLPEFRLVSDASYDISLSVIEGLGVSFGIHNEYNDGVNPPFEKNNLKYKGNLVYNF